MLCPECLAAVRGAGPRRVRPVPEPPGLPVVHAVAPYEDEVRALLLAHKERGVLGLAALLGAALAGAVRAGLRGTGVVRVNVRGTGAVPEDVRGPGPVRAGRRPATAVSVVTYEEAAAREPVLLVPVPSARRAVRARGHDPARRIALAAAGELRRTGTPARVLAVLRQCRPVADQAGLDSRQRLDNLAGALAVAAGGGRLLASGRIVLVDDLMTTGASLAEAARAVRAACRETTVYDGMAREEKAQRRAEVTTATEEMQEYSTTGETDRSEGVLGRTSADGTGNVVRAAVVAASPESFEKNRN